MLSKLYENGPVDLKMPEYNFCPSIASEPMHQTRDYKELPQFDLKLRITVSVQGLR